MVTLVLNEKDNGNGTPTNTCILDLTKPFGVYNGSELAKATSNNFALP